MARDSPAGPERFRFAAETAIGALLAATLWPLLALGILARLGREDGSTANTAVLMDPAVRRKQPY